ncbi:MAG TPA: hypothetical protein VFO29_06095 [Candidatus Rubrimentiphilum sp.]|nr:hypothetical protein [Candidatus Rubrimentiphilum sp.]
MEYMIGAGAVLETGEAAKVTPAMLHARVDSALAKTVGAAAIDFEGNSPKSLRRLLVLVPGWNAGRFRSSVTKKLIERDTCSLGDVLSLVAQAAQATEFHLFAHWLPDGATYKKLADLGIELIAHPLEAIESAALVAGQKHTRWKAVRAA